MTIKGRILGSFAVLLFVAGIGGGLAWFKYSQIMQAQNAPPRPEPQEVVMLADVKPIGFQQSASAVGTVLAPKWVALRNEVSGAILSIPMKSGQIVEKGAVLLELDKSVEQASYESAAAKVKIAESVLKRNQQAYQVRATTELEVEQSQAEYAQANAELSRLNAILEKKTIRSPFRGRVGLINVHEGQFLSEGTELSTLQGIDEFVYVDFMMAQSVADEVVEGQAIEVEHANCKYVGKILAIDSRADRSTRNLMARAEVRKPPISMSPYDSVKVQIDYGREIAALSVPIESLRRSPIGAYVYVVEPDKEGVLRAAQRIVKAGRTIGNRIAIFEGLKENERVIADGSFKVRPGGAVTDQGTQSASTETNTAASPKPGDAAAAAPAVQGGE